MSGHNRRNHDQLGEVLYPDREPRERSGEAASSSSSSSSPSYRAEVKTGILVDLGDSETSRMKREDGGTARMKREDDEAARMKREDGEAARMKREDDEAARIKREDEGRARMNREDERRARMNSEDGGTARVKREDEERARMKREDEERARMNREDERSARMNSEDGEAARMKREDGGTARTWREDGEAARSWREDAASSCFLLDDLKRLPQCDNKLGHLSFSKTHTILVDAPAFNCGAGILAQEGRDMWAKHFVKLPCSPLSVMVVKGLVKTNTQTRRWDVISKQLSGLAKKTSVSVDAVEEAIMKYNPKYKGQWSFDALSSFVKAIPKEENYFPKLFPKMAALALSLPDCVKKAIPLLRRGFPAVITLSQVQISCLLANAFFCTFPHRNASGPNTEYHDYPTINFTSLFGSWSGRKKEKLRALLHYFHVVTDEKAKPEGLVTFERRCLGDADIPNWRRCKEKMSKLHVTSHGAIEKEGTGLLQVDFASSWIGGGVLSSGLVQEEILFLINPELIVSRLFTEKLADNECLVVTGSQQFSCYSGFGDSFEWAGPHEDRLDRDKWKRRMRQTLAIDAVHFRHRREQYNMAKVTRELNKAYCGFKGQAREEPDIATGKWGCGAFNGDPQLKAVIQLMAAAKAKRGLAFFTFEDEELNRGLQQTYHLLVTEGTTVEKLYGLLEDYCAAQQASGHSHVDLFQFIRNSIRGSRSQL